MRRRRIISCKSKTPIQAEKAFSFSAFVLKLWLCEPLYLPALRATFLQRKASGGVRFATISVLCLKRRQARPRSKLSSEETFSRDSGSSPE